MDGEKLLVGVARWANHSCKANCDFYMGRGFKGRECVRLRAIEEIRDGEELLCFYNELFLERITLTFLVVTQNVMVKVLKKNLLKFLCQFLRRSDLEK